MADEKGKSKEKQSEETASPEKAAKSRTLVVLLGAVVVSLVAGAALTWFVLVPKMGGAHGEESAATEHADEAAPGDKIPEGAAMVSFDESFANVIMPDPNIPSSKLMYKVAFLCSSAEVAELITKNKPLFENILATLHGYHTRAELDDPLVKQSIQKEALQQSNALLEQLVTEKEKKKAKEPLKILRVVHSNWAVHD